MACASAAIAAAGACTVFNGLVPDPVDAGTGDAGAPDVGPVDPCGKNEPQPSTGEPGNDDAAPLVLAVTKVAFAGEQGQLVGFDLDGVCSCVQAADTLCGDSGRCDGDAGVDNALGAMVQVAGRLGKDYDIEQKINARIARGGSLLLVIERYNGTREDPRVRVSFYPTVQRDGGPSDAWIRDRAFFDGDASKQYAEGSVRDGRLVATVETELRLHPLLTVRLGVGTLSGSIDDARHGGELVLAGRMNRNELVALIGGFSATEDNGVPQCETPNWENFVNIKRNLCASADVRVPPGGLEDTKTACNALSVGMALTVVPASYGADGDEPPIEAGTCSTASVQCQ